MTHQRAGDLAKKGLFQGNEDNRCSDTDSNSSRADCLFVNEGNNQRLKEKMRFPYLTLISDRKTQSHSWEHNFTEYMARVRSRQTVWTRSDTAFNEELNESAESPPSNDAIVLQPGEETKAHINCMNCTAQFNQGIPHRRLRGRALSTQALQRHQDRERLVYQKPRRSVSKGAGIQPVHTRAGELMRQFAQHWS